MRVGFHQRGRKPPAGGREHHRSAHVPTAAEYDVWLSPAENPVAGRRCSKRAQRRTGLRHSRPAGQAAHAEGVEVETGLRDEPRFDAIRRPGERHACSAAAQRLRDRERGQHVAGCPPGRDQERWLSLLRHRPRC